MQFDETVRLCVSSMRSTALHGKTLLFSHQSWAFRERLFSRSFRVNVSRPRPSSRSRWCGCLPLPALSIRACFAAFLTGLVLLLHPGAGANIRLVELGRMRRRSAMAFLFVSLSSFSSPSLFLSVWVGFHALYLSPCHFGLNYVKNLA